LLLRVPLSGGGGRRRVESRSSAGRQQGMAGRVAYVWPVAGVSLAPRPDMVDCPAGARLAVERVNSRRGPRSVRGCGRVWNDKGFSEHYTEMGALETAVVDLAKAGAPVAVIGPGPYWRPRRALETLDVPPPAA